jgi:hypothetical protein
MTTTDFVRRRMLGIIRPDEQVRTVLFRFASSATEFAEVFINTRYESIADQEIRFRAIFGKQVISEFNPDATVPAKDWKMVAL